MAVAAGITRGASPAGPGQPAKAEDIHPLLDRCVFETAEQTIYETDLSVGRHWVLREHRIMEVPTLPGTTYLELGWAAFLHHAALFEGYPPDGGVDLRDVFFLSPLLLPTGERPMRVFLEKEGDAFNFRVASRMEPQSGRSEPTWQPHARGRVQALKEPAARQRRDVAEILSRCNDREMEITGPVMSGGEGIVYWGPHWQSLKRVHLGRGEALARIELPEEFAGEAVRYGLHPALLDVATGIAGFFEEESHLPLSYQRVRVHRHLPQRFYSYLRRQGESSSRSETIAVDVLILAEDGEVLIEVDHFTMRRVNDQMFNVRPAVEAAAPAEAAAAMAEPSQPEVAAEAVEAEKSGGILPHEGAEALRRALSRDLEAAQIVVTAKDLHTMIAQVSAANRSSLFEAAGLGAAPQAAIHARPNIPTPYVAPSTEIERRMAGVWQATLGIEQIGVNDNFFDLGGDSIMGIQLLARASEAGIQLSPDQLFEHQTIAELAKVLDVAPALETVAAGPLPVTAFQRELLAATSCWYAVWPLPAETAAGGERELLRRALEEVVARHEALRTRFTRGPAGWTQLPASSPEAFAVREIDLAASVDAELLAQELRASLDPERGLLVAAAVLRGEEGSRHTLLVAHPLAADPASWGLVREEMSTACRQLATGGAAGLPPAAGFQPWLAERIARVRSQGLRPESGAWLVSWEASDSPPPILAGSWAAAGAREAVSVRLDAEETRAVLAEIPDLQRVRPEEAVLAALAKTLTRGTGGRSALVRVEVDARDADSPDVDPPRRVGCFTVALPVLFDLGETGNLVEELRLAKEQFRGAVANGVDPVLLGELTEDEDVQRRLAALPSPEVSFAYFGDAQVAGIPASSAGLRVTGQLDGEGLRFDWHTGGEGLLGPAVGAMAADFLTELRALITVCRSTAVAVYTPSDFPEADLSQEELDKLFS
jgi:aryl carrier-like protein